MEPKIKIFEGYDLNKLMHQIKESFGEEFRILYQNEIKEKRKIPFFKKTKYILIVEPIENKISFEDILSEKIEEKNEKEEVQVYNPFKAEIRQETVEKAEPVIKTTTHNDLNQKLNIKEEYYDNNITYKEITEEFTGKALDLINLLIQKDVELDVAKEIVRNACGLEMGSNKLDLKHFTYRESLIEGIEKSFIFKGDIFKDSDRRRVVAFWDQLVLERQQIYLK